MVADVVGYSKLIGADEAGTLGKLNALKIEVIEPLLAKHSGRLFKAVGDGFLVEFASAVQAVTCAAAIQNARPALPLRIGIHVGDVVVHGEDLLGDGVNIAARIEATAEAGGIAISRQVHDQVHDKLDLVFEDRGETELKNIARPVRVFILSSATALASRQALALPDKPSIAVLPFQNMSGDPEQEYFADGMVEDIITALSRFKSLFVIARNSSFTYKGQSVGIQQVGRELGVRYVLEGSVRKAGGRVRITGQLIDGQSAGHMWADRFDGSIDDVFDLQDRIATAIVGAVVPRLDQAEIERATTKRTSNLDSYDHLLRGLAKLHLLNRGGAAAALDHFRAAIALDPNSSAAHAWASFTYMRRRQGRWMDDVERESREGMLFGKRAIELAKDDALALAAGGLAIAFMGDDLDAGLAFVDRALNVNPNLALGWQVSGWVRTYIGDPDTAIEHLTHAMRLSPLDPQMPQLCIAMAVAMRCAGRYLDSATWARKALQETPDLLPALIGLAAASALAGQPDDARRAAQRALEVDPGLRIALYNHNLSFRRAEDREAMTNGLRSAGIPD